MLLCDTTRRGRVLLAGAFVIAVVSLLSVASYAQDTPVPKYDIFTGYQWLHPGGTVPSPFGTVNAPIPNKLPDAPWGVGAAVARNFNRYLALEADYGKNWTTDGKGTNEQTVSGGPRLMLREEGANFFLHTLLSWNQLSAPGLKSDSGIGAILGGGIDLPFSHLITIRVAEADYVWARHNYSDYASSQFSDLRRPSLEGIRLRTGILWNFGYPPSAIPTAACSVQPSEVMVGEPVTATAAASNFNANHPLNYSWTSNGGKVAGNNNTASIDTTGMTGGTYTVTSNVSDPKMKKGGAATCSATYAVKEPPKNPPTMSCSVSPASMQAGGSATVTCTCTSPDGVPVTVSSWNSTGGTISGSGNTATVNTTGAAPGTINVTASCADSRGLTTPGSTQLAIEAAPAPASNPELEARLALHSIYFQTDYPKIANPNGGLVASQQQTLTVLASDFKKYLEIRPDAHLTLEGHADVRGSVPYNQALSQRRVDRTKGFLVEQGVPADHIDVKALGDQHNLTTEEVKALIEQNPELSPEERARILKKMQVIKWASNRRVDVTLSTTGQESVKRFPFNAADSLTLIGGREADMKAHAKKPIRKKKPVHQQ